MVHADFEHSAVTDEVRCGFLSMLVVMLGFTFFSASIVVGVKMANGLSFGRFAAAVLVSNLVLGVYCAALAFAASRTGLSVHLISRRVFGPVGSYLPSTILALTQIGWFGVGVAMFAIPTTLFLLGAPALQGSWWLAGETLELAGMPPLPLRCLVSITVVSGTLMTSSAYFGMRTLKIVSIIAVPAIVLLGGWSVIRALWLDDIGGLDTLLRHVPAEDSAIGFGMAVSLGIGSFVSGGTCTPDFARFARTPSAAALATVIAFLLGNSLMFFFGAVAAMVFGQEDISTVLCLQGLLVPAIAVLGLNIWTTNDNAIYTAGLGLSNITGLPKRHLVLACGFLGTLSSVCLYVHFCGWLSILNVFIPPFGSIILSHLFLCRGGRTHSASPGTAIIAWALGSFAALCGFGYLGLTPWGDFGIPAIDGMGVSAFVYCLLMVLRTLRIGS